MRNYELKKKTQNQYKKNIFEYHHFIISIELMDLSIITIATNITKICQPDFCASWEEYITIYEVVIKIRPVNLIKALEPNTILQEAQRKNILN